MKATRSPFGPVAAGLVPLPVGTRVTLPLSGVDTAVIEVTYAECPHSGCWKRAYAVRRDPGSFTTWRQDTGLWHAEDVLVVDSALAER